MRQWLKELRDEKKLTMLQMSEALGCTESYYSLIEKGERQKKMDLALATKLSVALDVPITEIIEKESQEQAQQADK